MQKETVDALLEKVNAQNQNNHLRASEEFRNERN